MNKNVKDALTTVRLTAEQMKHLERIGAREDRSISWLIRKAVDELIRKDRQQ
jgi:predicted transcriptional regulator